MEYNRCANIIVLGHTGAGKSSFINYLVGQDLMKTGNGKPVTQNFDSYLDYNAFGLPTRIFDSKGFEVGEYKKIADDTIDFINKKCSNDDIYQWIHTIFYCINRTRARLDNSEINLINRIKNDTMRMPHIILTNCDGSEQDSAMKKYIVDTIGQDIQVYCVNSVEIRMRRGNNPQFGRKNIMNGIFEILWFDMLRVIAKDVAQKFSTHFQICINEFNELLRARFTPDNFNEDAFKVSASELLKRKIDSIKAYNESVEIIAIDKIKSYVDFLNIYGKNEKFTVNDKEITNTLEQLHTTLDDAANSINHLHSKSIDPTSIFIWGLKLPIEAFFNCGAGGVILYGAYRLFGNSENDKRIYAYNNIYEQLNSAIKNMFPSQNKLESELLVSMTGKNTYRSVIPRQDIRNNERKAITPTPIHKEGNRAEATLTVNNKCGVHARPASILVQTASRFRSKIMIYAKNKRFDGKSILMWLGSGLVKGTNIKIVADRADSEEAVKALVELFDSKFGAE